jgi:hypothetical protein
MRVHPLMMLGVCLAVLLYGAATVPLPEMGVMECVPHGWTVLDMEQDLAGTVLIHREAHWHPECSWGSTTYETVFHHYVTPEGVVRSVHYLRKLKTCYRGCAEACLVYCDTCG